MNRYVLDPCRILPPSVEQVPVGFGVKHHPEREHGGPPRFESVPAVMPSFPTFPPFSGMGMFEALDWQMGGYDNGAMRTDERAPRGRRDGPGGPMRRGMEGLREHPYERRTPSWNEKRNGGEGFATGRLRMRDTRPLRSYRDLDAPQDATPELNY